VKGRQRKSKKSGISTLSFSPEYEAEAKKAEEIAKYLAGTSVLHDANAVSTMRNRIEELFPIADQSPPAWNLSTIVGLLNILTSLLDETTSQQLTRNSSEVEIIARSRASSFLSEFISALEDLKRGVIDHRLEVQTNISGNSLTSLDRQSIALGLQAVTALKLSKKITLKQARVTASQNLNALGIRVATREITPDRLKEWAKDYDLDGAKKEGK
jgi:hypothetical protein